MTRPDADEIGTILTSGRLEFFPPELLVPIDVRAMVAKAGDERARVAVAQGDPGRPPPFVVSADRPAGVHLHWAMPDGLTAATEVDGRAVFPPLPDRWMVVRLAPDPANPPMRKVRSWFLDAVTGIVTPGDEPIRLTPVPFPELRPPVVATGDADPAWAAVYDNAAGRFALHDDVADLPAGARVSYVVIGWYGDKNQDPVAGVPDADLPVRLARFGWSTRPFIIFPFPGVGRMLCHGSLIGVAVDGPAEGDDERPAATDVSLAVGQTDVEAMAALLTTDAPAVGDTDAAKEELILTASGYDRSRLFSDPEAITRLEELFHEAGFDRVSSAPAEDEIVTRLSAVDPGAPPEVVRGPAPVWFLPRDPVVALRGAGRSLRHGEDGRFDPIGHLLACRFSTQVVSGLTGVVEGSQLLPDGALEPPIIGKGGSLRITVLPGSVQLLVRETMLLDPYGIDAVTAAAQPGTAAAIAGEQTLAAADLGTAADLSPLHNASIRGGLLPSPVGWNVWRQAWAPVYVEWELEVALDAGLDAWHLDELDLDRDATPMDPAVIRRERHRGRSLFTTGPAARLASQAGLLLDETGAPVLPDQVRDRLETVAGDGRYADLSAAGLDGLVPWLLGLAGGVRAADPDARDRVAPPWLARAGVARLTRLRLIDTFGRFLDLDERLPASRVSVPMRPTETLSDAVADLPDPPQPATPAIALAPRLSRPGRVRVQVCGPDWEPLHPGSTLPDRPPVAGWLLPDLADGAIEVFTPEGEAVGQVRRDPMTGTTLWEPPPGEVRDLGAGFSAGLDEGLVDFLRTLVAADGRPGRALPDAQEPSAVDVVLRLLDVTSWTSEPLHDTSASDVAGLAGVPTAVLRVRLTLEVTPDRREAGATAGAEVAALTADAEAALAAHPFEMRVGALTRAGDSVRGFLRRERPGEFTLVHPAVLEAAGLGTESPVSISSAPLAMRPGVPVDVLVICDLAGLITVTTGVLPRTAVQLPAEWTAGAPRLLSSFRFGPLLVDPTSVRMPAPMAEDVISRWVRRPAPTEWADDVIVSAPSPGDLPVRRARSEEGWIVLRRS